MYDHFTGELDNRVAKLPESFQQPRIMDMVLGQYALVSVEMIWVNEDDEVRLDGAANIETEESALPYESYVYAVMLENGIALDLVQREQEKPIKLDRTALAQLMDEEGFDLSQMIDVVWVVSTEREQDQLCEKYTQQTGQDLYDIKDVQPLELAVQPEPKAAAAEATPTKPKKRRFFMRKGNMQGSQQDSSTNDSNSSIEN